MCSNDGIAEAFNREMLRRIEIFQLDIIVVWQQMTTGKHTIDSVALRTHACDSFGARK